MRARIFSGGFPYLFKTSRDLCLTVARTNLRKYMYWRKEFSFTNDYFVNDRRITRHDNIFLCKRKLPARGKMSGNSKLCQFCSYSNNSSLVNQMENTGK